MAISLDLDSFSLSRQSEYSLRRLILESNCSLVFINNIKMNIIINSYQKSFHL